MEDSNVGSTGITQDNFEKPSSDSTIIKRQKQESVEEDDEAELEREDEADLKRLLMPDVGDLPLVPPSAVDSNFVSYFAPGFLFLSLSITSIFFRNSHIRASLRATRLVISDRFHLLLTGSVSLQLD